MNAGMYAPLPETLTHIEKRIATKHKHDYDLTPLMQACEGLYQILMNKCIVLNDMLSEQNQDFFASQRIQLRKKEAFYPSFGTLKGEVHPYAFDFNRVLTHLEQLYINKKEKVKETLNLITSRTL